MTAEVDELMTTDYLNILINAKISESAEHDKQHMTTLNQVRDSQSLVLKTPWIRHTR